MTDSAYYPDRNTDKSTPKRSLSPDEGEIVEDVKRRRASPQINSGRHNDGRRHRIVYGGQNPGRGYGNRDRGSHDARGHEDSYRYRERGTQHDDRRPSSPRDREDRYSSQKHREWSTNTPRNRSVSTEHRDYFRDRTSSPRSSAWNTSSPSPKSKQVRFPNGTKPPSTAPDTTSTASAEVPILDPIDEEAVIEERRRKRETILAKYQGQSTPSIIDDLKIHSADVTPAPGSPVTKLSNFDSSSMADTADSPPPGSRESTPDFEADDEKTFEFTTSEKKNGTEIR